MVFKRDMLAEDLGAPTWTGTMVAVGFGLEGVVAEFWAGDLVLGLDALEVEVEVESRLWLSGRPR